MNANMNANANNNNVVMTHNDELYYDIAWSVEEIVRAHWNIKAAEYDVAGDEEKFRGIVPDDARMRYVVRGADSLWYNPTLDCITNREDKEATEFPFSWKFTWMKMEWGYDSIEEIHNSDIVEDLFLTIREMYPARH